MRTILTFILLVLSHLSSGQSYNEIVSDSMIHSFMKNVLYGQASYESEFNKLPKSVLSKPVHIGKADWEMFPSEDTTFEAKFQKLFKYDTLLSNEDFEFIKKQYYSIKDTDWRFSFKEIRFKKTYKKKNFKYSIPLFSKDFKRAVFWRYYYRGPLWAMSELHIYKWENGKWTIEYLIAGWIS